MQFLGWFLVSWVAAAVWWIAVPEPLMVPLVQAAEQQAAISPGLENSVAVVRAKVVLWTFGYCGPHLALIIGGGWWFVRNALRDSLDSRTLS